MEKNKKKSDLMVIVKAKELCAYVMTVTQKSPKQFRYTFTSRLQNLTLDIMENLMRANDIFLQKGDVEPMKTRLDRQHSAMSSLQKLSRVFDEDKAFMELLKHIIDSFEVTPGVEIVVVVGACHETRQSEHANRIRSHLPPAALWLSPLAREVGAQAATL